MWRKHPLSRFIIGMAIGLVALLAVISAVWLGADFWEDGKQTPAEVAGTVELRSRPLQPVASGRFRLTTTSNQLYTFEMRSSNIARLAALQQELGLGMLVTVSHSPKLRNVYTVQVGSTIIEQDLFDPSLPFQGWQKIPAYILIASVFAGVLGLLYGLLALLDLMLPPRKVQGYLLARVERAESSAESLMIILRPWENVKPGKQLQFELAEADFLATDSADFVAVEHTPIFKYVQAVRPLPTEALPPQALSLQERREDWRFSYSPGWRANLFLYGDAITAFVLFVLAIGSLAYYLPEIGNTQRTEPPQWVFVPLLAVLAGTFGVYMLMRFRRKLEDLRAPKRITTGPILSKWRVTRTSNDNRRLIVVADGQLESTESGVRKFDLSPALFDQLQVGDIVEIEHTPRLRYIFRLEVKGHQELSSSFQS